MDEMQMQSCMTVDARWRQFRIVQGFAYASGRNDEAQGADGGGETESFAFAYYWVSRVETSETIQEAWDGWLRTSRMNRAQREALTDLCERYGVPFGEDMFARDVFGLPADYVTGQVGPIYVGCDANGHISS